MLRFNFTLCLCASLFTSFSQSGPYLFSGTNHLSNGQIGILLDNSESAIVLPAMLPDFHHGGWHAGAALRTGIDDLVELAAAAHLPLPWKDHVAVGIQHTGIEGYDEQRITLSYARKLFQKLNAAVQFDLNRNSAEEYVDLYAASWSVSIYTALMKEFSMAAFIYNPLGTINELDLPALARIGILYSPSEKLGVAIEAEKDWRYEARFKAGINYHIHPRLSLRWGIGTEPSLIHAGLSWNLMRQMSVNGGWRYHSRLGSALSAGISQFHDRE